jgi:hypothetical protein
VRHAIVVLALTPLVLAACGGSEKKEPPGAVAGAIVSREQSEVVSGGAQGRATVEYWTAERMKRQSPCRSA